jgi:hypothetical protein
MVAPMAKTAPSGPIASSARTGRIATAGKEPNDRTAPSGCR